MMRCASTRSVDLPQGDGGVLLFYTRSVNLAAISGKRRALPSRMGMIDATQSSFGTEVPTSSSFGHVLWVRPLIMSQKFVFQPCLGSGQKSITIHDNTEYTSPFYTL